VAADLAKDEDWQLAARVAAFLGVDRDACRKAFNRVPVFRVRAVVLRVPSERHSPGYDAEETIENWAADRAPESTVLDGAAVSWSVARESRNTHTSDATPSRNPAGRRRLLADRGSSSALE
jgi:hypothetical protein